jgi:hypothetical protein
MVAVVVVLVVVAAQHVSVIVHVLNCAEPKVHTGA